jgi:hypothetical protein
MRDRALDGGIILDTELDVFTRILTKCASCGHGVDISELEEVPEVGLILRIEECTWCAQTHYRQGLIEGGDERYM